MNTVENPVQPSEVQASVDNEILETLTLKYQTTKNPIYLQQILEKCEYYINFWVYKTYTKLLKDVDSPSDLKSILKIEIIKYIENYKVDKHPFKLKLRVILHNTCINLLNKSYAWKYGGCGSITSQHRASLTEEERIIQQPMSLDVPIITDEGETYIDLPYIQKQIYEENEWGDDEKIQLYRKLRSVLGWLSFDDPKVNEILNEVEAGDIKGWSVGRDDTEQRKKTIKKIDNIIQNHKDIIKSIPDNTYDNLLRICRKRIKKKKAMWNAITEEGEIWKECLVPTEKVIKYDYRKQIRFVAGDHNIIINGVSYRKYLISNYGKMRNTYENTLFLFNTSNSGKICRVFRTRIAVHNLMWETFVGPIPGDKCIKHKDGKQDNLRVDNLYLADRRSKNKC